jgi:hypothetical protein
LTPAAANGSTTVVVERAGNRAPFDDRPALEALERLRERLEQARSERRALQEEFDRFVLSFNTPSGATDAVQAPRQERARAATGDPPVGSESPPVTAESLPVAPASVPVTPDVSPVASVPLPPWTEPPRATSRTRALLGGGLILLAGGGLVTWMLRNGAPEATPSASPAPVARPASPAPEPPAAAAAEPSSEGSELATIRRVWVRVLVDGERVIERELPADTRVPLTALESIVIRTGDAGAVRLSIGGQDQGFLGREGEVVTRTFTVPAPPAR